jgi:hypothetical protein
MTVPVKVPCSFTPSMGFPMLKVTPNLRTCRGCGSAIGVARRDLPPADVMSLVMNTDRSVAKRPQRGLIPSASPVVSATRQIPASWDRSGACSGSGHPDFRRKAPRPSLSKLPCGRRIDPAERHHAPRCFKNPEEHLGRCRYVSICGIDPFSSFSFPTLFMPRRGFSCRDEDRGVCVNSEDRPLWGLHGRRGRVAWPP